MARGQKKTEQNNGNGAKLGFEETLWAAADKLRGQMDASEYKHVLLARLYPKLRTWFPLSGKNPGFLANTFSTSEIIDEVQKVKLPSHKGFSDSDRVANKMDKAELRADFS